MAERTELGINAEKTAWNERSMAAMDAYLESRTPEEKAASALRMEEVGKIARAAMKVATARRALLTDTDGSELEPTDTEAPK